MSKTIATILTLKDQFSSVLKNTTSSTKVFQNQIKNTQNTIGAMKSAVSGVAKTLVGLTAAAGVGLGFKSMLDSASAVQNSMAQMNAVLTSTKGAAGMTQTALVNLATSQSKLSLQSKNANIDTENLLLTFTKIGKDTFPQALTAVNDMSQALGQDTKSSAIQLGKALNDPINGVTALKRVGVTFTDQQKEQIKTMVKAGDTLGAQKIILAELTTEFGGSALAASKTFSGQITVMKNNFKTFGGSIASAVLPYFTQFVTYTNQHMPQIQQVTSNAINYIVPKFQSWVNIISKDLSPAFKTLASWVTVNFPIIRQDISDMITLVVGKFQKIIDIVGQITSKLLPDFKGSTTGLKTNLQDLVNLGLNLVIDGLTWIRDNLPLCKNALLAYVSVWGAYNLMLITTTSWQTASKLALLAWKDAIIVVQTVQGAYNAILGAYDILMGEGTLATKVATATAWLWNAALDANPIGATILLLVALSAGIYEVVKHWKEVCDWVEKAWDWLTKWNGTKVQDKTATVTTNYATGKAPQTTNSGGYAAVNGSHANGLKKVPYDGYIAEVHKNEAIIPASQNPYNSNNKNKSTNGVNVFVTIQGNVIGNEEYANSMGEIIVDKVKTALANS